MELAISKKDLKWIILCMSEGIGEFHHPVSVHCYGRLEFRTKYFYVDVASWLAISKKQQSEIEQFEAIINGCVELLQNKNAVDFDKVMEEVEKLCPFNDNSNLYFGQNAPCFIMGGGREKPESYFDYMERKNGGEEDVESDD